MIFRTIIAICFLALWHPPSAPAQEAQLIARAQRVSVAALDSGFQAVPFARWLATLRGPNWCAVAVPLRTGLAWTYTGSALWSGGDGTRADSGDVSWTMTIVAARDVGSVRVALVRGFVSQLARYEPGKPPRLSLLACRGSQLFGLEPAGDSAARHAYDHWGDALLQHAELLLDLPLHDGQLFGQKPPRDDALYAWTVAAVRPEVLSALPTGCGRGAGPRFELSYRSLPEHAVIEWQPGLGITRYAYGHHGTPAAADVRLRACR